MNNENPQIKNSLQKRVELNFVENRVVNISSSTVFELIRDIKDPEHPYSLEQLNVVNLEDISIGEYVKDESILCSIGYPIKYMEVIFTPTVPHCSLAGVIGLTIKYVLSKFIAGYWLKVSVKEFSHSNYSMYNKQLGDNDRVMAAFENEDLIDVIHNCLPEKLLNRI